MKQKTILITIGIITASALGYYVYTQSKNKKVQDVKAKELEKAASGTPVNSIAVNEPVPVIEKIDPSPIEKSLPVEQVSLGNSII